MLVAIGVYFSRRQKGIESFFLAGLASDRPATDAALNSGIDYLAVPSTIFNFGLIFTASALSWVFLYPWVAYVSLPFYPRLETVSAYEYLDRRFTWACEHGRRAFSCCGGSGGWAPPCTCRR